MRFAIIVTVFLFISLPASNAEDLVFDVDAQPLRAQVKRLVSALDYVGQPLPEASASRLKELEASDDDQYITGVQKLLDYLTLAEVHINPESRVKVSAGKGKAHLQQNGWSAFLIKVHNEAGVTAPLRVNSPSNGPIFVRSTGSKDPDPAQITTQDIEDRWLELGTFDKQPLTPTLSGLELEYRILAVYSSTTGKREATLTFDIGQGTQDLGFRSDLPILFNSNPSTELKLRIFDHDGRPTVGQFIIRDLQGRVYPSRFRRCLLYTSPSPRDS